MACSLSRCGAGLSGYFLKPLLAFCFAVYHASLMLLAPVIAVRLGLALHPGLKDSALAFLRTLFPDDPSGFALLLLVIGFLVLVACLIALGAVAIRIPLALVKWNIARLTGVLYGKWTDSLAYLAMTLGPAIHFTVALAVTGRVGREGLFGTMLVAVISQFGVLAPVALHASLRDTRRAWKAAGEKQAGKRRVLLEGALVPAFALPLFALAGLTWITAIRLAPDLPALVLFHASLAAALYGSIVFYRRHYREFLELLFADNDGEVG